ncbi:uncharacterized protein V1516DRAFT_685313 [Lipomyces oligophaga]|uniref:uncharacterized protein n=1 Tax=Lipomyces oligophaga TaxID=45792 RepID=UPI0034CDF389
MNGSSIFDSGFVSAGWSYQDDLEDLSANLVIINQACSFLMPSEKLLEPSSFLQLVTSNTFENLVEVEGSATEDLLNEVPKSLAILHSLRSLASDNLDSGVESLFSKLSKEESRKLRVPKATGHRRFGRSKFSRSVQKVLLASFEINSRPSSDEISYLADLCGLTESQVRNWFRNGHSRRALTEKRKLEL